MHCLVTVDQLGQGALGHGRRQGLVALCRVGHPMHGLMRRAHVIRLHPGRHGFDALAFARQHQPFAGPTRRLFTIGAGQGAHDPVSIAIKPPFQGQPYGLPHEAS